MVFASATSVALIGGVLVHWLTSALDHGTVMPLYLACVALPFYALSQILDATARAYNAIGTALLPPFVLRPLLLIAAMAAAHAAGLTRDATTGMAAFAVATWATSLLQLVLLQRCVGRNVPAGPRSYHLAAWLKTSAPMFAVWASYMLLLYVDVLVLRQFQPPDVVAHYYAASKTLALVAFIHFAVSAAVAHRFAAHHVAGNREALTELARSTVRWTFWPSLLAIAGVLALGKPILWLFGPGFGDAYPLMFILAIALLARAAVGPAERVLNMLGEQNRCALVYACMFAFNLIGCVAAAGPYGSTGVAWVIAAGATIEAALLFLIAKRRLGLHMLIGR
jgi:O-antigen/teichoic acid export membrane protein